MQSCNCFGFQTSRPEGASTLLIANCLPVFVRINVGLALKGFTTADIFELYVEFMFSLQVFVLTWDIYVFVRWLVDSCN